MDPPGEHLVAGTQPREGLWTRAAGRVPGRVPSCSWPGCLALAASGLSLLWGTEF